MAATGFFALSLRLRARIGLAFEDAAGNPVEPDEGVGRPQTRSFLAGCLSVAPSRNPAAFSAFAAVAGSMPLSAQISRRHTSGRTQELPYGVDIDRGVGHGVAPRLIDDARQLRLHDVAELVGLGMRLKGPNREEP